MTAQYAWFDAGNGRQVYRKVETARPRRSALSAPMINSDTMPEIQSMVDGKVYTSKSAMRASYKPSGNREGVEYTEVGNDPARLRRRPKPKVDRKVIKETVQKAAARFNRGERVSKQ